MDGKGPAGLIFGSYTGEPGAVERLNLTVWNLVKEQGLRHFTVGPDDDFDWLAARAVLPQVGHVVLHEPFPCGWVYGAVEDIRRRAEKGKLTLWDISFPDQPPCPCDSFAL